jgi:Protein of unknown function (DUF3631)
MKRRAPDEYVEAFRHRVHAPEGYALRDKLARWAGEIRDTVRDAWPEIPDGIEDRNADVWEPLLAVADAAGGDWPDRARVAAVTLVTESALGGASLGIRLLGDLRTVFGEISTALPTNQIIRALRELDESPWDDLRGKPLDPRGLARRLAEYGVERKTIRIGDTTAKGYRREDFYDAWQRYLTSPPLRDESVTAVTEPEPCRECGQASDHYNGDGVPVCGAHVRMFVEVAP